jgi:hypothetical protein
MWVSQYKRLSQASAIQSQNSTAKATKGQVRSMTCGGVTLRTVFTTGAGDDQEQFVHGVVVAAPARQQGQQALPEKKQHRDLDQRAQHAEDKQFRVAHGMFRSPFFVGSIS